MEVVEYSCIRPIGTNVDAKAALKRRMNNINEVWMKGGFSSDNVDRLYSDPFQSVEHGPGIVKGHIRNKRHGLIETELTGLVAPEGGVELYVVGTFSHEYFLCHG